MQAPAGGTAEVHLDTELWTDFPDTIGGGGLTAQLTFAAAGDRTIYLNGSAELSLGGLYGENSSYLEAKFTPSHPIAATAGITVTATPPPG